MSYEESYKSCMDAHRIQRKLTAKKSLAITLSDGRNLTGRGYPGAGNSFFSELSYGQSYTGINVTQDLALTYTAYWACVRLLSETLASLPCITYRRLDRGKERAVDHPNYFLLHDEPNPEMDSFTFFETLMYHLVACAGNCYSYIDWNDNLTEINALWIMRPDKITVMRDAKTGEIVYRYQFNDGARIIPSYRVWHIPGLGYDGLIGYTPLTLIRQSIGLGLATEKFGAKIFGNGLALGGVLEHPGHMSLEAQRRFKKSVEAEHEGLDRAHKLLVLEEGMKYQKNNIPPEDAQFLETRKFQKGDMATFFHVPPHMIGDLERATFSNIEEQSLEFVVYTMRPWLVRFERSAKRKLFLPWEKPNLFSEFLVDGLLRGDILSRYQAYAVGRNWGWLSADDVCELENRNPLPDGQGGVYMAPANMLPAGEFESQRPKPVKPKQLTS